MSPSSSDGSSSRAPRSASCPPSAAPVASSRPSDRDNAKKSAWANTTLAACSPSSSNADIEVAPIMGPTESWPALGESAGKAVPKSPSPPSDATKISSKSSSSRNSGGAISSPIPSASGDTILPEKKESLASPRNNNTISSPIPSASGDTILPEKKESLSSPRNNNINRDHGSSSRGGGSNGFLPQIHGGIDAHHQRPFNRRGNNNGGHRGNGGNNYPRPRHVPSWPIPTFFGPVPPVGPTSFFGLQPVVVPVMGFPAEIPSHVYYGPPPPFVNPYVDAHPMVHAMPLPMVDNAAELRAAVSKQIEYYFSNDNLVKDTYLRKRMDDQGWVPISLIAGFHKVKILTTNIPNNINFIVDSIRYLELVEVQGERIRRRGDWMKWLMKSQPNHNGRPFGSHSQSVPNVDHIQRVVLDEGSSDRSTSGDLVNQQKVGGSIDTSSALR